MSLRTNKSTIINYLILFPICLYQSSLNLLAGCNLKSAVLHQFRYRIGAAFVTLLLVFLGSFSLIVASAQQESAVYMWGWNRAANLGDGTTTDRWIPTQIYPPPGITAISKAGVYHMKLAILQDRRVAAWGDRLGEENPGYVPHIIGGLKGVKKVASGYVAGLALKYDGTVVAIQHSSPTQLTFTPIPGLSDVIDIAAGVEYYLALKSDGTVVSWNFVSDNLYRSSSNPALYTPTPIEGLSDITQISVGVTHALALKADGSVVQWTYNRGNQIGSATYDLAGNVAPPSAVPGLFEVITVSSGGFNLALKQDGTVWAWSGFGSNERGEFGTAIPYDPNVTPDTSTPVQIDGLSDITAIAAGSQHGVALKQDGTVWTWGSNSHGQLGDGNSNLIFVSNSVGYQNNPGDNFGSLRNPIPQMVPGLTEITAVSAGDVTSTAAGLVPEIQDNEAPVLSLPDNITVEATSEHGAAVNYQAAATDNVTSEVEVVCNPASGSTFPMGTTTVSCTATDNHTNTTTGSFTVTVQAVASFPTSGLVGRWLADGNPNDSVGNNHLTLHNGVTYTAGKSGQAFSFNGVDSYAKTTLPTYSLSGGTVSLWFMTRSLGRQVITGSWNGNNGRTPTFYIDNGTMYVEFSNFFIQPVMPINANQWYHVAMTYDSGYTVKVYLNGVLAKQGQASHPGAFPNEVGFGAYVGPTIQTQQFFDGLIDEISIHDRPLTSWEIIQTAGDLPPILTLPVNFYTGATSSSGKIVTYFASAKDPFTGNLPINCNPSSGSNFPIGKMTVTCSATDDTGNTVTGSFEVNVYHYGSWTTPTYYITTPIGSFRTATTGNNTSIAYGINVSGQVVGYARSDTGANRPFLWQAGTLVDLASMLPQTDSYTSGIAYGINDSGTVVGYIGIPNGNFGAFVVENGIGTNLHSAAWTSGVFQNLGNQNQGFTRASKINNAGQVIGDIYDSPSYTDRGFIYQNGVFTKLNCPGYTGNENGFQNIPQGINNLGDVVGACHIINSDVGRGFLWSADGSITEIGSLGWVNTMTFPLDINDSRKIVGEARSSNGEYHAFFYENGVITDIGALISYSYSRASAINNSDQIVGSFDPQINGPRGFIYQDGIIKDINELTQPSSEGVLHECNDINDVGQIVCNRRLNNGFFRAEVLTPVQDTTAPQVNVYDLSFAATSSSGAVVDFSFNVSDDWDRTPSISYSHPSGTLFSIGTTTVSYTASDDSGNTQTGTFTVTVIDEPPVLSLPESFTVFPAPGQETAVVTYEATAHDTVDGPRPVTCTPATGLTFPLGWTTVNCSSTDLAGNTATGSFIVHVFGKQGDLDLGNFNGAEGSFFDQNYSVTRAMVLQPDGKIVVGGNAGGGGFSLARFDADGTPDTTFGPDGTGRSTPDFPDGANATVFALKMQTVALPGGGTEQKIIAAGQLGHDLWGEVWQNGDFVVARYNLNGSLDTSFGSNGLTIVDMPNNSLLTSMGLQSDGKIVVAGHSRSSTDPLIENMVVQRFTADGVTDTSFGAGGTAVASFQEEYPLASVFALAIQPDEKIVIGGYLSANINGEYSENNNFDVGLARFTKDGVLDAGFGTGGKAAFDFKGEAAYSHEGIMGLALQPDGKIIAVGERYSDEVGSFLVTRHNPNGSLDSSFGDGGKVVTDSEGAIASDVLVQPDGKLVVAGGGGWSDQRAFRLVRYNPDGSSDPAFGLGGTAKTDFAEFHLTSWWYSIAQQPDGKIVAAGTYVDDQCNYHCAYGTFIARYLAKSETVTTASNKSAIYSSANQTIPLTANTAVKNSNIPLTQGSVTFQLKSGGDNVGSAVTAQVTNGAASANYVLPGNTPVGSYTIEASFDGADGFSKSSAAGTLTIGKAATNTSVISETIASGATSHTLRAFVKENLNSAAVVNAGTVTFTVLQGTTAIGTTTVSLSNNLASAEFNTSGLADGVYKVSASYGGTGNLFGSNGAGSFTKGNSANPVPAISSLSPTSTEKGSASFTSLTVNGTGFISTSKIRARGFDPQAGTIVEQDLTTFFTSTEQLSATTVANAVLGRMVSVAQTLEITVVSPIPVGGVGGGASNKQAFFVTDTPVAVTSVASSTTDPTTGTATATTTTTTGGTLSATAVPQTGTDTSEGTLTVAQYDADPIGTNSTTTSPAFSDTSGGYFDVHVSPTTAANYETLSLSYCSTGTTLYWWTGTEWALVVSQSYDSNTGCINVTLNNTTSSPTITQLTGTVFGVSSGPAVGQVTISPTGPLPQGSQINLTSSFTDPGAPAGVTYKAGVFWGDGQQTTIQNVARGVPFNTSITYPTPGVYTVRVKVTRSDNSFGSSNGQQFVVVTDTGASVSGGGWINSPAGAYAPNPMLKGKATFGFTSKYQKGAQVPSGNTQFTFHGAGMSFKSTAYEWLVVAGARAKYKGTGTINGTGSYGFMLTAIDGQINGGGGVDKFRVKIWDIATGAIIYDNQMGAGDDATPTTVLGGGSIVIHSGK